jgi:hypothetical protein
MSRKASTAALEPFSQRLLHNRRRAPRHPASEKTRSRTEGNNEVVKQGSNEEQTNFGQVRLAIPQEKVMNGLIRTRKTQKVRVIFPVVLRIMFALVLCALGVASARVAQARAKEQRVVKRFAVNRAKAESLQRWVNAGHDTWCRNPEFVASATLERIAPKSAGYDYELASQPVERKKGRPMKVVYTFHSLDGRTTYRITLRHYRWLLPAAGTMQEMVWIPEGAEIVTTPTQD